MEQTIEICKRDFRGLCFVNLVDFDALWGHRRNVEGYGKEIEKFDKNLGVLLEEMREMIAEQLNCEESSITESTSFKDDLGADSLDLFELVMALEEKYEVEIPSEELAELTTVGAVMEYLKNKGVEA